MMATRGVGFKGTPKVIMGQLVALAMDLGDVPMWHVAVLFKAMKEDN